MHTRVVGLAPLLALLCAPLALLNASCGPSPEGRAPPGALPGTRVALAPALDVPPPATSATPIAPREFALPLAWTPRRPLIAPPSAPPPSTGTVDDSGDETALADILIGSAPAAFEAGKPAPADLSKAKPGVRMVIDSPYEIFSKVGTYIHLAAWTPTFAPASNARVFIDGALRGRTNGDGTLVFRDVPSPSGGGGTHSLRVVTGSGVGAQYGEAGYHAYARTASFERANLYVYTDRGLFGPGETIHVRAFAWRLRGDYRPFSDASVNVLLRKDGKVFSGGRVKTDTFGIASLDLPLPTSTPEGAYELAVEHLGERATARLQVKHFVAPIVKIEHDLPRFLTRDSADLVFELKLTSATGEAFKEGTINWRAIDPKGVVVGTESRSIHGGGPHKFTVDKAKLASMRDAFADGQMAALVVEVVDGPTGRRDELRRDLQIARVPYRLVIETDRNEHVPGETVKIVVHATDLEQAPVAGQEIALRATDGGGRDVGRSTIKSDATGLAQTTMTMPKGSLTIYASLVKTPAVNASAWVAESEPRAMFADVAVASVKEREPTPIEVRFPSQYIPAERVVHADVVDSSGALIHSFLLPIKNEGGTFVAKGSFPAPSWGSMLMTFFALGAPKGKAGAPTQIGLLTDGANLPVIASRPITVTLKAPSIATPGEKITIDVALIGPKTKSSARPFELGASMSEDALLALLDPLEHSPTEVLYNPERKVMASTGSQILTWPVVQKTWGTWNYDIALPPFGFRPGGAAPKADSPADAFGYGGVGVPGMPTGESAYGTGVDLADVKKPASPEKPTTSASASPKGAPASADTPKMMPPPPPTTPSPSPTSTSAVTKAGKEKDKAVDESATDRRLRDGEAARSHAPETLISIRTDFAPTSLWLPRLSVPLEAGGLARITASLPDAITTQRLTIVATDDRGAIGIGRASIRVEQDLSVRSDIPATLTQGDELEVSIAVRSTRDAVTTGNVTLSAPAGIAVVGAATQALVVPAKGTSVARFRVRADGAGRKAYTAAFVETRVTPSTAKGPMRDDREERTVLVQPLGAPIVSTFASTLTSAMPLAFEVERREGDTWVEADLAVAFPSAIPMIEGLQDLIGDDAYVGVDPDASKLLGAIAIEGYLLRNHGSRAAIDRVHDALARGASTLVTMQQPDGGFGWRWELWAAEHGLGTGSSPYVTSHALLALAKLRDTDVAVPDQVVSSARSYLLRAMDPSGKGEARDSDVSNVAFWEGDGEAKRRAATMSAFHAIAASERGQPVWGIEKTRLDALAKRASEILRGGAGSEDPLTLAEATMGLYLHALATSQLAGSTGYGDDIQAGAKSLLASYRTGYWEPSWFHAWGGRIEATRGAIELLTTIAPGVYEADLHDAAAYLLATRPSWGAWHNAWGTAAAIEGLALLDPTPPEKSQASVKIAVDGRTVATASIDAADPFTSAASLRAIDLAPYLSIGKHEVRIAYDGALAVPASLTLRRWANAAKQGALGLQIERVLVGELTMGATTNEQVQIISKVARPEVVVSVPLSPGAEVDEVALHAMVRAGTIASFRIEGSLVLSLHALPAGTTKLMIPLRASRRGSFQVAAMHAFVPRSPEEAWSGSARLAVR